MFFLSIPIPDFIPSDRSVKTFVDFIGFSPVRKNKIFCFSFAYSKNSLNGGTPYCAKNFTLRFCQTPPVGRSEKARRHSPELQWSPIPVTEDELVTKWTLGSDQPYLQLQKSTPKFRGFINHSLFSAFKIRITIKNEMISKSFYPTFRDHFNYIIQPLRIEY